MRKRFFNNFQLTVVQSRAWILPSAIVAGGDHGRLVWTDANLGSATAVKEIGATIGDISQIASTIAGTIQEQSAATQEIARNVQHVAEGTSKVANNIREVTEAAAETGSASSQVLSSAQALSAEGVKLKSEISKCMARIHAA